MLEVSNGHLNGHVIILHIVTETVKASPVGLPLIQEFLIALSLVDYVNEESLKVMHPCCAFLALELLIIAIVIDVLVNAITVVPHFAIVAAQKVTVDLIVAHAMDSLIAFRVDFNRRLIFSLLV